MRDPSSEPGAPVASSYSFDSVEDAIRDIREGKIVIVVDDEGRENEGDFVCAAECITPELVNFMIKEGRGLLCVSLEEERARELQLNLMVEQNNASFETAFTVSVDYRCPECTTGISARDRAATIRALVDPEAKASDFMRPGHIFPLIAKKGGVLRRSGHTEASLDLSKLAGCTPGGVLVEILNDDGTMARLPELFLLAKKFDLRIISIKDLIAYRMQRERIVEEIYHHQWQSPYGTITVHAFRQMTTDDVHIAFVAGSVAAEKPTRVRVMTLPPYLHVFAAIADPKVQQIHKLLQYFAQHGGILLLMRHSDKYQPREDVQYIRSLIEGVRTASSSKPRALLSEIERDIGVGSQILKLLGVRKIHLLSNRPLEAYPVQAYGLEIVQTTPVDDLLKSLAL